MVLFLAGAILKFFVQQNSQTEPISLCDELFQNLLDFNVIADLFAG